MSEWWAALELIEKFFWGISIVFSVLFVIQFVLSLIGLDFDADGDTDIGGHDVDGDFTFLSVRSFIAFFTFFGWTGVAVLSSKGAPLLAIGLGIVAGLAAMAVVGYTMYLFMRLQHSGTLNMSNAIDAIGEVYLIVPPNKKGMGKVQVKVQGSLRELDAITTEGKALSTGTLVRIIDIIDDKILLVEPESTKYLPPYE